MQFRLSALLITLAVSIPISAAEKPRPTRLSLGKPAPAITLDKLLQVPDGTKASWESLKGKVVVLEFWATWCSPCVGAIPHLNKMVDKFKDKPVQFIAITNEKPDKVKAFLKKTPIHGWIGLDMDESMCTAYQVDSWPLTVVVDKEGIVTGITSPDAVTPKVIRRMLTGKHVDLPKSGIWGDFSFNGEIPFFCVVIRPWEKQEACYKMGCFDGTSVTCKGDPLQIILAANGYWPRARIEAPDSLPDEGYELIARVPKGYEDMLLRHTQQAVEATLGVKMRREKRMKDVYVMVAGDKGLHEQSPKKQQEAIAANNTGSLLKGSFSMESLVSTLEPYVGRPVINETGLKDRYKGALPIYKDNPEAQIRFVHDVIGLEFKPDRRSIEVLVVEKLEKDAAQEKKDVGRTTQARVTEK